MRRFTGRHNELTIVVGDLRVCVRLSVKGLDATVQSQQFKFDLRESPLQLYGRQTVGVC